MSISARAESYAVSTVDSSYVPRVIDAIIDAHADMGLDSFCEDIAQEVAVEAVEEQDIDNEMHLYASDDW